MDSFSNPSPQEYKLNTDLPFDQMTKTLGPLFQGLPQAQMIKVIRHIKLLKKHFISSEGLMELAAIAKEQPYTDNDLVQVLQDIDSFMAPDKQEQALEKVEKGLQRFTASSFLRLYKARLWLLLKKESYSKIEELLKEALSLLESGLDSHPLANFMSDYYRTQRDLSLAQGNYGVAAGAHLQHLSHPSVISHAQREQLLRNKLQSLGETVTNQFYHVLTVMKADRRAAQTPGARSISQNHAEYQDYALKISKDFPSLPRDDQLRIASYFFSREKAYSNEITQGLVDMLQIAPCEDSQQSDAIQITKDLLTSGEFKETLLYLTHYHERSKRSSWVYIYNIRACLMDPTMSLDGLPDNLKVARALEFSEIDPNPMPDFYQLFFSTERDLYLNLNDFEVCLESHKHYLSTLPEQDRMAKNKSFMLNLEDTLKNKTLNREQRLQLRSLLLTLSKLHPVKGDKHYPAVLQQEYKALATTLSSLKSKLDDYETCLAVLPKKKRDSGISEILQIWKAQYADFASRLKTIDKDCNTHNNAKVIPDILILEQEFVLFKLPLDQAYAEQQKIAAASLEADLLKEDKSKGKKAAQGPVKKSKSKKPEQSACNSIASTPTSTAALSRSSPSSTSTNSELKSDEGEWTVVERAHPPQRESRNPLAKSAWVDSSPRAPKDAFNGSKASLQHSSSLWSNTSNNKLTPVLLSSATDFPALPIRPQNQNGSSASTRSNTHTPSIEEKLSPSPAPVIVNKPSPQLGTSSFALTIPGTSMKKEEIVELVREPAPNLPVVLVQDPRLVQTAQTLRHSLHAERLCRNALLRNNLSLAHQNQILQVQNAYLQGFIASQQANTFFYYYSDSNPNPPLQEGDETHENNM